MNIPSELRAGDSASWVDYPTTDNLGDLISSADWALKYRLVGAQVLTLTAVAEGDGWSTSITKAQTATLGSGDYHWQAYVESGSERVTLGGGKIKLLADLSTATAGSEQRSQAAQDLAAVQAAIRALVTSGAKSYTIGGRSLTKIDVPDLLLIESRLKAEVVRERKAEMIASGLGNPSNVYVRFRR